MTDLPLSPTPVPEQLALSGELTIYTAAQTHLQLRQWLHARQEQPDALPLTLTLQDVTEADTAGLQLLLATALQAEQLGLTLHLAQPSPAVCEAATLLGLAPRLFAATASPTA